MRIKILKRLQGEDRTVFLVDYNGRKAVLKVFENEEWKKREAALRRVLQRYGIRVPKILEERKRAVVEEYIDGTLLDNVPMTKELVEKVLKELKKIHEVPASAVPFLPGRGKCLIYGDATGDNIILDRDGNIWFIDWSSARKGFPETDIRKFRRWLRREARRAKIIKNFLK